MEIEGASDSILCLGNSYKHDLFLIIKIFDNISENVSPSRKFLRPIPKVVPALIFSLAMHKNVSILFSY